MDEYLAAYSRTPHCATGVAPASLLFGRQINDTIPSLRHSQPVDATRAAIVDHDHKAKEGMKRFADHRSKASDHGIRAGDRVLRRLQSRQKTDAFYESMPWTVSEVRGDSVIMQRDDTVCRRHATQVKRLTEPPEQSDEQSPQQHDEPIGARPHPRQAKDPERSYREPDLRRH